MGKRRKQRMPLWNQLQRHCTKGYSVNTNIGSSEYCVDIGIIDPESPDRYLLGLLCDGYNYVASHTAHDRDVTTPAVLSLLGWRTYNIWSVEWWDTPEHVLSGIIREVERVKAKESAEDLVDNTVDEDIKDSEQTEEGVKEEIIIVPNSNAKVYITGNLPIRFADSAMFSQGYYTDSAEDIRTILETEAPISRRLLIKRLINNYGISRNDVRINSSRTEVFEDVGLVTSSTEDIFYWKDKEQLDNYSGCRLSSERESLDIAPEEVAQAIQQVLKEQFAIDEGALISETARLFGYVSIRDNVNVSMKRGIGYALKKDIMQLDGSRYKLNTL